MSNKRTPKEATELTVHFFESVLAASNDGIVITDYSFTIIKANQSFASIFGTAVNKTLETNLLKWVAMTDQNAPKTWSALIDKVSTQKSIHKFEFIVDERIFEIDGSLVKYSKDLQVVLWIWRDITEQKHLKKSLQKAHDKLEKKVEERTANLVKTNEQLQNEIKERKRAEDANQEKTRLQQTLMDTLPCVAMLLRPHSREIVASNKAAADLGAVPGKTCYETFGQRKDPCPWCLAPSVWATQESQHLEVEGLGILWDANWFPISDNLYLHYAFDITERKQADDSLRESEERFRRAILDAPFPIMIHADDGEVLQISKVWTDITGYPHSDIPTISKWTEKAYGQRKDIEKKDIDRLYEINERVHEREYVLTTSTGEKKIWDFSSAPLGMLQDGRRLVVSMASDVTERKQVEDKLKQQQYYLEKAQELGQIGTWDLDLRLNKLIWTDENCRIFGVPGGTVVNYEIFLGTVHPDDREYVDREWKAALEGKPYDIEHRIIVDGKTKWVREKADVDFDKEGKAVKAIGFTQDITERKQTEDALKESEENLRSEKDRLEETNVALKVLLDRRDQDMRGTEGKMLLNVRELVLPYIEKLEKTGLNKEQKNLFAILETNLNNVISPFLQNLSKEYLGLTHTEIKVANFIKEGKSNKEIATFMGVSKRTIDTHREHIRKKLGINTKKVNLKTHLLTIQ